MKRFFFVLVLVVLILVPATSATLQTSSAANSKYAVGLNLGTNTGIGFQYRMNDKFDVIGNLGLRNFGIHKLALDAAANFKVYEFSIEKADFVVTLGLGGYLGIPIQSGYKMDLAVLVPVGLVYSIDKDIVPIDLYFRLAPGAMIIKDGTTGFDFGISSYLGALWRFN
jgi:hypothetical protein